MSRAAWPFRSKKPSRDIAEKLSLFETQGYVVLNHAIDAPLTDEFWREVTELMRTQPAMRFSRGEAIFTNEQRWAMEDGPGHPVMRVIDIERYSTLAPALFFHDRLVEFLTAYFRARPTCLQTLAFEKGSEQGPHADKYLVSPGSVGMSYDRDSLVASWIACEDADDDNGALVLYPGSHALAKPRFGDDIVDYAEYSRALEDLCGSAGIMAKRFHARKGDVLFWRSDLIHAGGAIKDQRRTRRSLVSHYAKVSRFHPTADKTLRRRVFNNGVYFT